MTQPSRDTVLAELAARAVDVPPGRLRLDDYGDSPEMSRALIALILEGRKRAGTALLWSYEHEDEALPEVGDVAIVLDHEGAPVLVARVVRVDVLPFDQVDEAYAAIEGEGDGSLAYWRAGHWDFFSRECATMGRVPEPAMPVVCTEFEVVATVPRNGR